MLSKRLGLTTATFTVITSMIGTGIFVTTGDILAITQSSFLVLCLWLLGGLIAICGALSYAELAAMMPHSGGEYVYLRNIFGTLPSFLSGWVSLIVGFSASIAISVIALQLYLEKFLISLSDTFFIETTFIQEQSIRTLISCGVVVILGVIHAFGIKLSVRVQNTLSILKISIILSFIVMGFWAIDFSQIDRIFAQYTGDDTAHLSISAIGIALLIVSFAYSGWNGATYIAEEVKKPEKNLPKSLFGGTMITIIFYICMNFIFLMSASGEKIIGQKTVGEISAKALFSEYSAVIFHLGILLILFSSISVQMLIGPRVYYAMAKDRVIFKGLAKISQKYETPYRAILLQAFLVLCYILFNLDLGWLMTYMGFALSIFPLLTVIGLFYLRWKEPKRERPYRVHLFPWVPLFFVIGSLGMMIAALIAWSWSSIVAIIIVLSGIPVFYIWKWLVQLFWVEKTA